MNNTESREAFKQRLINSYPKGYSIWFQLLLPSLIGLCFIGYLLPIADVFHWSTIPIFLFFIFVLNGLEYLIHRYTFHKRLPVVFYAYARHTGEHHMVYPDTDMSIKSLLEIRLIMIPMRTLWILVGILLFFYYSFAALGAKELGALFVITTLLYTMLYEWLHLMFHISKDAIKNKFIRKLAAHHTTHHNFSLMRNYNFNVVMPLWDYIFKTTYRPSAK